MLQKRGSETLHIEGKYINFLGQPAKTSMSIASIALKYEAIIVPAYGIRNVDNKILC